MVAVSLGLLLGLGNLQRHRIIVLLFEVFRDGAEIEEKEARLLIGGVAYDERIEASPSAFDLNIFRRREDRAKEADVKQVTAVVAGGEHVHGDRDALGAFAVAKFFRQHRRLGDA